MKKAIVAIACIYLVLLLLTGCPMLQRQAERSSFIADTNLEDAIRKELGIRWGRIEPEDLARLTELYASWINISDISGLEYAVNLEILFMRGNRITDISALEGLTKLEILFLHNNRIVDISPLENLTSLRKVDLWGNEIVDISPLARNEGLGEGSYVDLRRNAYSSFGTASLHDETLDDLESRGVVVFTGDGIDPIHWEDLP
ncbi:MAG: Internalin-A [Thermotogales bacterium 46_20]|nr:MAG: Internalin-A [Thermotogales bacterium 46_20]